MNIKLPASITQAKTGDPARSSHQRAQPVRELRPTVRTDLSRRPSAAPRRSAY
ncbi:hypothetical protein [Nonomuraea longicatena]|uniref:Uncharacterized protein n=1 Tax=Nonomuraea longicatena TaxID=83682 RepID=A0ABP4AU58_9ACTN